jgi:hypothetical protein
LCAERVTSVSGKFKDIIIVIIMTVEPFVGPWLLFQFLDLIQLLGLLGREISPYQGLYLHTEQHKHRMNADNTDIYALSAIQIYDSSGRRQFMR